MSCRVTVLTFLSASRETITDGFWPRTVRTALVIVCHEKPSRLASSGRRSCVSIEASRWPGISDGQTERMIFDLVMGVQVATELKPRRRKLREGSRTVIWWAPYCRIRAFKPERHSARTPWSSTGACRRTQSCRFFRHDVPDNIDMMALEALARTGCSQPPHSDAIAHFEIAGTEFAEDQPARAFRGDAGEMPRPPHGQPGLGCAQSGPSLRAGALLASLRRGREARRAVPRGGALLVPASRRCSSTSWCGGGHVTEPLGCHRVRSYLVHAIRFCGYIRR